MKNSVLISAIALLLLSCSAKLNAQQGVSINASGANPANSAMLDVSSTTKGLLIPRMSTAERNAIASPDQALQIYNTTTKCFEFYENGGWYNLGCVCNSPFVPVAVAGSGASQTQFSANWNSSAGATGYYLDVSTDASFSSFVSGYNSLNAGNVLSYNVTGLTCNTVYYYRLRAYNTCGISGNSNEVNYSTSSCVCPSPTVSFTYYGQSVVYGTVESNTSPKRCWFDRNLGASQVATAYNDASAYGDYFQWGRLIDGHQQTTSGTTTSTSSGDAPGHSNFIINNNSPWDWRVPQNPNLWQGTGGINNPCPSGWRIATGAEWDAERLTWSSNDYNGAFASPLKLTVAGWRDVGSGTLMLLGTQGYYWSSTIDFTTIGLTKCLHFLSNNALVENSTRGYAYPIRCIKD